MTKFHGKLGPTVAAKCTVAASLTPKLQLARRQQGRREAVRGDREETQGWCVKCGMAGG